MYDIKITAEIFRGKTRVEQHQLVNDVLKPYLSQIHGYNLQTKVPVTKPEDIEKAIENNK